MTPAEFVPARTAEYAAPGFWQARFEAGDAHEWFGAYAAFRPLLAPRLRPGARPPCSPRAYDFVVLHSVKRRADTRWRSRQRFGRAQQRRSSAAGMHRGMPRSWPSASVPRQQTP